MKLVEDFLNYNDKIKRLSANTRAAYTRDLNKFFAFHSDPMTVDTEVVLSYIEQNTSSASTIGREISAVKMFYEYLILKKLFQGENPTKNIERPKVGVRVPKYLHDDEASRLFELVKSYNGRDALKTRAMMLAFMTCGLRKGDFRTLNIDDDHKTYIRVVGKGNKEAELPIIPDLRKALDEYYLWRAERNPVDNAMFVTSNGTRVLIDSVESVYEKMMRLIGREDLSPHKMRHTFATRLAENGVPVTTIKELMRHASINTTLIYTHATMKGKTEAVNNLY